MSDHKHVLLIGNADTAQYNPEMDAYFAGVVVPADAEVTVTDLVIQREKEAATIYYVIQRSTDVPDEDVEGEGDEAPEPE